MSDRGTQSGTPASTAEWRDIARAPNLYYHILSLPGREAGLTAEDFYATGESDWQDFSGQWLHYCPGLGGSCIEIGCGAGRITRALAASFQSVVALDVSADMISLAREVCPPSVEFQQVNGAVIPAETGSADALFSVLTLQHLDGFEAVRGYLAEAHRVLRGGGSLMVDLTLAKHEPPSVARRARAEIDIWRSRRGLRKGKVHKRVRWREYPWEQVRSALEEIGFQSVEFRMFAVSSSSSHYHFWLARKPDRADGRAFR